MATLGDPIGLERRGSWPTRLFRSLIYLQGNHKTEIPQDHYTATGPAERGELTRHGLEFIFQKLDCLGPKRCRLPRVYLFRCFCQLLGKGAAEEAPKQTDR